MKGRLIVIDQFDHLSAAALVIDGQLEDLLFDPADPADAPETIFCAIAERQVKGQGGQFVRLAGTRAGFLRRTSSYQSGQGLLVQVSGFTEPGKARPVTDRIVLKRRYAIGTLASPGINISRRIVDAAERDRLRAITRERWCNAPEGLGVILRSACDGAPGDSLAADLDDILHCARLLGDAPLDKPSRMMRGPTAAECARRDWCGQQSYTLDMDEGGFERHAILDMIEPFRQVQIMLASGGSMVIEPTRAFTAIDINTGSDLSSGAALKTAMAATRALPRQVRVRGIGGQIVIDFPPLSARDKHEVERALATAFKGDSPGVTLAGWTRMGHFEIHLRRAKPALEDTIMAAFGPDGWPPTTTGPRRF